MMYSNKFVAAIKYKNKVCREHGDTVYLPFGSEYSLLLKNLNSVRAVVSVSIDGSDVLDNNRIIVNANDSVQLDGFMRGSTVVNSFKFIEKTKKIERYRGNRPDDGLVRVEFWFERPPLNYTYISNELTKSYHRLDHFYTCNCCCSYDTVNEDGITVKGTELHQDYSYSTVGELEPESHVIVLRLKGKTRTGKVSKPVLTRSVVRCSTCGTSNKTTHKYCGECGTYLL